MERETMRTEYDEDLTAFEQWAVSRGYDISISKMLLNADDAVIYDEPVTRAAFDGWLAGVVVGLKSDERPFAENAKFPPSEELVRAAQLALWWMEYIANSTDTSMRGAEKVLRAALANVGK